MAEKPYDRLDGVIWYDGKLVPWSDAMLHVCSHGLHYASSVFEGERAYGGEIFKCSEHSERLKQSAQTLDFEIPYSGAEIDAAMTQTLRQGDTGNAVGWAQIFLNKKLGAVLAVDGIFGERTTWAVWSFQLNCQRYFQDPAIELDGIIGPVTWYYLTAG